MNLEVLDRVFHAYDIRGLVGVDLNEEFYYNLGKAFVTFLKAKNIVVGYDIRPESKTFSDQFIKGATELGCNVKLVGEIATEMLYFAVGTNESMDGGATITASHNPSGWNGCKMVAKNVKAMSSEWGLKEIKEIILTNSYFKNSEERGKVEEIDIYPDFKRKILSILKGIEVKSMSIVVDAGNGIGGRIFDYVFGDLDLKVTKMYFEPDGNFPNHVPNPLKEENTVDLRKKVLEIKADLGVAIDGDADRLFFIDSRGRNPSGVFTGSIFAKDFCQKFQNSKIIHDVRSTLPIANEVAKAAGVPVACKAGHSFFKDEMRNEDAIFGAEMSSHFYYKDFFYADSGMMTIAHMLRLLHNGLNFSDELDYYYSTYFLTGEVNYKVNNKDEVINKIKANYQDGKLSEVDGISVDYPEWRFNIRKSNTEPLIRLNVEGYSKSIVKEKFLAVEKLIGSTRENKPII